MKKLIILLLIVSACSSSKDDPKPTANKYAGVYQFQTPFETIEFLIADNNQGDLDAWNCFINRNIPANSTMVDSNMKIHSITIVEDRTYELTITLEDLSFGANNSLIARHVKETKRGEAPYSAENLVINRIAD